MCFFDNARVAGGGGAGSGSGSGSDGLVRASIDVVSVSEARRRTTTTTSQHHLAPLSSSRSSNSSHLCINNCMSSSNISKNISIGNTGLDLILATSSDGTTFDE